MRKGIGYIQFHVQGSYTGGGCTKIEPSLNTTPNTKYMYLTYIIYTCIHLYIILFL